MKNLILLDTETTSLDKGRLIELSYGMRGSEIITTVRCKNPVPIELEAMATHFIEEQELEDLPLFKDNPDYRNIKDTIETGIVVAHNAPFDIGVLIREGIHPFDFIDTRRVAKHLFPDAKNHKLQFLRFYLGCKFAAKPQPHSAEGDVIVLKAVFEKLYQKCQQEYEELDTDPGVIEKMKYLSHTPALVPKILFGMHYGKTFEQLRKTNTGYLIYLRDNPRDDEDVNFTVNYWLKK